MYSPIVAIEVAAEKATDDPSDGKARQKARNAASQIVLMGAWNLSSTWWKNAGSPLSLEKANIIRLLLVKENNPACQTHMMTRVKRTIAPSSPKISIKIWSTGCPTLLSIVAWKSWIENSRQRMRNQPNTADAKMEIKTPNGELHDAFFVSSERCADASNPVMLFRVNTAPRGLIASTYVY